MTLATMSTNKICASCGTLLSKKDFICDECGAGFCKIHVGTNAKYRCGKCGDVHTQEVALKFNERCPSLLGSTCPKCNGKLHLDKLPAGQVFLSCEGCGWNSFENQPLISYKNQNIVLNEATKLKLLGKKGRVCGGKLKKIGGNTFCPACLVEDLKSRGTTSFSTIGTRTGMEEDDVPRLLDSLNKEYHLTGIVDEQNKLFTFVDPQVKYRIHDQLKLDGYISLAGLARMLGVEQGQAVGLMYDVIRTERIRGTFSRSKQTYYTSAYLQQEIVNTLEREGFINLQDFAARYDIVDGLVKDYISTLFKARKIEGIVAAKGNLIYSKKRIQDLVFEFAMEHKHFKLEDAAKSFNIAIEVVRSVLHELVKQGRIRGVFTQKREYMTDIALRDEIIRIVTAYRTISLSLLASKLSITERTVEESLASLIARGDIAGYIDLKTREFKLESIPPTPAIHQPSNLAGNTAGLAGVNAGTAAIPAAVPHEEKFVEVVREYDFIGGQVHFKIAIRNNSPTAIYDVKVVLDYPDAFQIQDEIITVPVIEPDSSRGVDFYLEPTTCGRSHVGATVIYKDFTSKVHTINVKKKEVWIKCPLVVSTMDTLDDVNKVIASLPSDARSFLISDIDARLAYHAGFRAISHFDTRCVAAPDRITDGNFEAEAYFAMKAKNGGRIVIKLAVSEKTQIMEIRVWCAEAGQLTGLLAKIIEYLFQEINMIRKIKAESREKTIDLMAIAQGITVLSDYVMLNWKFGDISNKLEDIYARLMKFLKSDPVLDEMKAWLDRMRDRDEDENIDPEMAEQLSIDVERWHQVIQRTAGVEA